MDVGNQRVTITNYVYEASVVGVVSAKSPSWINDLTLRPIHACQEAGDIAQVRSILRQVRACVVFFHLGLINEVWRPQNVVLTSKIMNELKPFVYLCYLEQLLTYMCNAVFLDSLMIGYQRRRHDA